MAINQCSKCTVQRWASPRHYTVDPMLLPSGNPFKCHEDILFLQTMIPPKLFNIPPPVWDAQKIFLRPTLMHTKNLYENGPNPFFFSGTKNMSEGHLMHTVLVCCFFDKLGQACLCG